MPVFKTIILDFGEFPLSVINMGNDTIELLKKRNAARVQ